jgi:hypothetical protein
VALRLILSNDLPFSSKKLEINGGSMSHQVIQQHPCHQMGISIELHQLNFPSILSPIQTMGEKRTRMGCRWYKNTNSGSAQINTQFSIFSPLISKPERKKIGRRFSVAVHWGAVYSVHW